MDTSSNLILVVIRRVYSACSDSTEDRDLLELCKCVNRNIKKALVKADIGLYLYRNNKRFKLVTFEDLVLSVFYLEFIIKILGINKIYSNSFTANKVKAIKNTEFIYFNHQDRSPPIYLPLIYY